MNTHSLKVEQLRAQPRPMLFVDDGDRLEVIGDAPMPQYVLLRALEGTKSAITLVPTRGPEGAWIAETPVKSLVESMGACRWELLLVPAFVEPNTEQKANPANYRAAATPDEQGFQRPPTTVGTILVYHRLRRLVTESTIALLTVLTSVVLINTGLQWNSANLPMKVTATAITILGALSLSGRALLAKSMLVWRHALTLSVLLIIAVAPFTWVHFARRQKIFNTVEHSLALLRFGPTQQLTTCEMNEIRPIMEAVESNGMQTVAPGVVSSCEPNAASPALQSSDLVLVCRNRWLDLGVNAEVGRALRLPLVRNRCLDLTGPRCNEAIVGQPQNNPRMIQLGRSTITPDASDGTRTRQATLTGTVQITDINEAQQTLVRRHLREYELSTYGTAPIESIDSNQDGINLHWVPTEDLTEQPVNRMHLPLASRQVPTLIINVNASSPLTVRCAGADETRIDLIAMDPTVLSGFAIAGEEYIPLRNRQWLAALCRSGARDEMRVTLDLYLRTGTASDLTQESEIQRALQKMVLPPYIERVRLHERPAHRDGKPEQEPVAVLECPLRQELLRVGAVDFWRIPAVLTARRTGVWDSEYWFHSAIAPGARTRIDQRLFWVCEDFDPETPQSELIRTSSTGEDVERWSIAARQTHEQRLLPVPRRH